MLDLLYCGITEPDLLTTANPSLKRFAARPTASSFVSAGVATPRSALFHSSVALLALSMDARKKIDEAVKTNPLVIFMKGTPELPMCGFSRAVCQIMEVQGVKAESLK